MTTQTTSADARLETLTEALDRLEAAHAALGRVIVALDNLYIETTAARDGRHSPGRDTCRG